MKNLSKRFISAILAAVMVLSLFGNVVGTAKATPGYYMITYVDNGVTDKNSLPKSHEVRMGVSISVATSPLPQRTNYVFGGYKAQDGKIYKPGQLLESNLSHDWTLTPVWTKENNPGTYTIKFIRGSESGVSNWPTDIVVNSGALYTIPKPTRTGYTCTGFTDQYGQFYPAGQAITVIKALTLSVVWGTTKYAECLDYPVSSGAKPNRIAKVNYTCDLDDPSDSFYVQGWAIHDRGIASYSYELTGKGIKKTGALEGWLRNEAALIKQFKKYTANGTITTSNYNTNTGFRGYISTKDLPGGSYTIKISLKTQDGDSLVIAQINLTVPELVDLVAGDTTYKIPKNSTIKVAEYTKNQAPKPPYGYKVVWYDWDTGAAVGTTLTVSHNTILFSKNTPISCKATFMNENGTTFKSVTLQTNTKTFRQICGGIPKSDKLFVGWKMDNDPKGNVIYLPDDTYVIDNTAARVYRPVYLENDKKQPVDNLNYEVLLSQVMLYTLRNKAADEFNKYSAKAKSQERINTNATVLSTTWGVSGTLLAIIPSTFVIPGGAVAGAILAVGGILIDVAFNDSVAVAEAKRLASVYKERYEYYDGQFNIGYMLSKAQITASRRQTDNGEVVDFKIWVFREDGYK